MGFCWFCKNIIQSWVRKKYLVFLKKGVRRNLFFRNPPDLEEAVIKQLVKNPSKLASLLFIDMYLDDAMGSATSITIARYCLLVCTPNNYKIQYAPNKLQLPATRSTHLAITLDTMKMTAEIPPAKVRSYIRTINDTLTKGTASSKKGQSIGECFNPRWHRQHQRNGVVQERRNSVRLWLWKNLEFTVQDNCQQIPSVLCSQMHGQK